LAIDIRDNERNGRAKLVMVEDGAEPEALTNVSERFPVTISTQPSSELQHNMGRNPLLI